MTSRVPSPGSIRFHSRLLARLRRGLDRTRRLVGLVRLGAFLRRRLGVRPNRLGLHNAALRYRHLADPRPLIRRPRTANFGSPARLVLAPLRLTLVPLLTPPTATLPPRIDRPIRERRSVLPPSSLRAAAASVLRSHPTDRTPWMRLPFHPNVAARTNGGRGIHPPAVPIGAPPFGPNRTPPSVRLVPPRFDPRAGTRSSAEALHPPATRKVPVIPIRFANPGPRDPSGNRVQLGAAHAGTAAHPLPPIPRPRVSRTLRADVAERRGVERSEPLRPTSRARQFATTLLITRPSPIRHAITPTRPALPRRPSHPRSSPGTASTATTTIAPGQPPCPLPQPLAAASRKAPAEPGTEWIRNTRREVTETVLREVQTTVEREVVRRLQPHSEEFRRLGEALCADLGSRMAFERERLGLA